MAVEKPTTSLYAISPDNYDAMMTSNLEMQFFKKVLEEIKDNLKPEKTLILDLCCGTGILAEMLLDVPNIEFIGVDKNEAFLAKAKERTKNHSNFKFILADVLKYETDLKFDIIILTSAYHHIEDKFKTRFLKKIHSLLKENGIIAIWELLVPKSSSDEEYKKGIEDFYLKRIEYVKKTEGMTKKQFDSFMNACGLSAYEEEYKVDYEYVINDLNRADFKIIKETKVWPKENEKLFDDKKVGDFVFVVKKK